MEMCVNADRQTMRRLRFDRRLIFEMETMHADDVRHIETVAENHMWMTSNALHRKPQNMRAI
jgi:hypothetical protein